MMYMRIIRTFHTFVLTWNFWTLREAFNRGANLNLLNLFALEWLLDDPIVSASLRGSCIGVLNVAVSSLIGDKLSDWLIALSILSRWISSSADFSTFSLDDFANSSTLGTSSILSLIVTLSSLGLCWGTDSIFSFCFLSNSSLPSAALVLLLIGLLAADKFATGLMRALLMVFYSWSRSHQLLQLCLRSNVRKSRVLVRGANNFIPSGLIEGTVKITDTEYLKKRSEIKKKVKTQPVEQSQARVIRFNDFQNQTFFFTLKTSTVPNVHLKDKKTLKRKMKIRKLAIKTTTKSNFLVLEELNKRNDLSSIEWPE